jgi:hypothetical protein
MATTVTTPTAGRKEVSLRAVLLDFPWLWHCLVVRRSGIPLWALSVAVFAVLYAAGLVAGALAGDARLFISEVRWVFISLGPALGAFLMGYLPTAVDRLWDSLSPWLANPTRLSDNVRRASPRLLTGYFWLPFSVLWAGALIQYCFADPAQVTWMQGYPRPEALKYLSVVNGLVFAYFIGGASAVASVGLARTALFIQRRLDLRPDMVYRAGKEPLRGFNHLLYSVWAGYTAPLILLGGLNMGIEYSLQAERGFGLGMAESLIVGVIVVLAAASLAAPQVIMTRLLRREKREAARAVRREMEEALSVPETAGSGAETRAIFRYLQLGERRRQVEGFTPTLVDAHFLTHVVVTFIGLLAVHLTVTVLLGAFLGPAH